jgi:hypothetical protein
VYVFSAIFPSLFLGFLLFAPSPCIGSVCSHILYSLLRSTFLVLSQYRSAYIRAFPCCTGRNVLSCPVSHWSSHSISPQHLHFHYFRSYVNKACLS